MEDLPLRITVSLVHEFAVEDLPLSRVAALVPEFAVKDLPLGRTAALVPEFFSCFLRFFIFFFFYFFFSSFFFLVFPCFLHSPAVSVFTMCIPCERRLREIIFGGL